MHIKKSRNNTTNVLMFDLERIYENEMKEMLIVCNPNKSVHVFLKSMLL